MEIIINNENQITIAFKDFLNKFTRNDAPNFIQEISDCYQDYKVDCSILNKIVGIIIHCSPDPTDLETLDTESLIELLKIATDKNE